MAKVTIRVIDEVAGRQAWCADQSEADRVVEQWAAVHVEMFGEVFRLTNTSDRTITLVSPVRIRRTSTGYEIVEKA